MSQCAYKFTGLATLSVASICLIAVVLSLSGGEDHRAAQTAESTQQPTLPDTQHQEELIPAVVSDRIEQLQDQIERMRGHVADLRPEPTRHQQLQEYFEVRDALELQNRMIEEFNTEMNRQQQFKVQIYIPPQNATE